MWWIELIGLVSTLFVLISFLFNDIKLIRVLNMLGSILFVVYGILLGSLSVWILNGCLVFVHLYYILKYLKESKEK